MVNHKTTGGTSDEMLIVELLVVKGEGSCGDFSDVDACRTEKMNGGPAQ